MSDFECPACFKPITLNAHGNVPWHLIEQYRGCPTSGFYVARFNGEWSLATLREVARRPPLGGKPDDDTLRR